MKKPEIARRMAKASKSTVAEAADCLDRMVHEMVSELRKGNAAHLPGLGKFRYDLSGKLGFRREGNQ